MINKFQTGGNIEMQLAQELVQLGLPEESVQQLTQNKDLWGQLVQIYQQEGIQGVQAALQQLTQTMRHGAKLNYIKQISGICPEGTQLTYFKAGGRICSKCEAMAKKKQGGGTMDDIRAQLVEKCGGKMKKNNGGKMKNGNKICPKCGKIHSGKCGSKMKKHQLGGIITAMQKFKNGGSLNGVPFMQSGNIVRYNPMVHGISMTKSKQQLIDEYNTRQDQINTHMPQPSPGVYNSQPTSETNGQMLARKVGEIVGNTIAPIRVPVKAAYNWLTSTSGTNIKNQQAYNNRNKNSYDIGKRFLGLKRGGSLKNKAIAKGQTGLVMNDPTYRTQEEVDRINTGNRNLARGLFKDLTSGNIAPSIQNIGRMISAGYRGYLEPERVNKLLTGEPPAVGLSSSLFVKPSTINYVANPAEKAARADFLKEATNKFEKTIAGSGKISKGTMEDWRYPNKIMNKLKGKFQSGGYITPASTTYVAPIQQGAMETELPYNVIDYVPLASLVRSARRYDMNPTLGNAAETAFSAAGELASLGFAAPIIKGLSRLNKVKNTLKATGYAPITKNKSAWMKVISQPATGSGYNTFNKVSIKNIPTSGYVMMETNPSIALQPASNVTIRSFKPIINDKVSK